MKFALTGSFRVVSESIEPGEVEIEVEDWMGEQWMSDLEGLWQEYINSDGEAAASALRDYNDLRWRIFQELSSLSRALED